MPKILHTIITKAILRGICSFSGGIINIGQNIARKMKKLMRLHVSTFADAGRVFAMYANLGPMTAPRMIFTACPPQDVWMPILVLSVMLK